MQVCSSSRATKWAFHELNLNGTDFSVYLYGIRFYTVKSEWYRFLRIYGIRFYTVFGIWKGDMLQPYVFVSLITTGRFWVYCMLQSRPLLDVQASRGVVNLCGFLRTNYKVCTHTHAHTHTLTRSHTQCKVVQQRLIAVRAGPVSCPIILLPQSWCTHLCLQFLPPLKTTHTDTDAPIVSAGKQMNTQFVMWTTYVNCADFNV
jgi:hypothetical protein